MLFSKKINTTDMDLMAQCRLFHGLSRQELSAIADRCKLKPYKSKEHVVEEGDLSRGIFVLLKGNVQVYLPKKSQQQQRVSDVNLARLTPGAVIGEYSLIDDYPASASARCEQDCRFAFLSQLDFEEIIMVNDRCGRIVYKNLLKSMIQRLRDDNKQLDALFIMQ